MTDYFLTVEANPKADDWAALEALHAALYPDLKRLSERRDLGIFIRSDDGAIGGGVYGWLAGGWLYVDTLWLHDSLRGGGYGSALLDRIEQAAAARGVTRSYLETTSFQARPFYEKRGYRVFLAHRDFVAGHDLYRLMKEKLPPPDSSSARVFADHALRLDDPPSEADASHLQERLIAFNQPFVGDTRFGPLAVFLRREDDERVIGGLAGWRFGRALSVESIWFDDRARDQGMAARALASMERELTAGGGALLSARVFIRFSGDYGLPLFEAAGYAVMGTHEDFPAGYRTYFLHKTL